MADLHLVMRQFVRATPARLFEAWTTPTQFCRWWTPPDVVRVEAAFDLKVGGAYRIVNHFADGRRITIAGLYQVIEPPHRLVFTWQTDITPQALERVTVRFEGTTDGTDITVIHKRIATADQRDSHARGWRGCLAGLTDSFSQAPSSSVALPSASPRPTLRT